MDIEKIISFYSQHSADATFTLEQRKSKTIKRVRMMEDRIVDSSIDLADPVLVYTVDELSEKKWSSTRN